MVGNEVLMVSGSDVHGTPITVRADAEGVTAQDIVDRYHGEFVRQWDEIGLQWDLYTTTGTDHHARVTQEMFLKQLEQGFIDKRTSEQFFDPEADRDAEAPEGDADGKKPMATPLSQRSST